MEKCRKIDENLSARFALLNDLIEGGGNVSTEKQEALKKLVEYRERYLPSLQNFSEKDFFLLYVI